MSLLELEKLLKELPPMMSGSMEKAVDKAIKFGAVFAEVCYPQPHRTGKTLTPVS